MIMYKYSTYTYIYILFWREMKACFISSFWMFFRLTELFHYYFWNRKIHWDNLLTLLTDIHIERSSIENIKYIIIIFMFSKQWKENIQNGEVRNYSDLEFLMGHDY